MKVRRGGGGHITAPKNTKLKITIYMCVCVYVYIIRHTYTHHFSVSRLYEY